MELYQMQAILQRNQQRKQCRGDTYSGTGEKAYKLYDIELISSIYQELESLQQNNQSSLKIGAKDLDSSQKKKIKWPTNI